MKWDETLFAWRKNICSSISLDERFIFPAHCVPTLYAVRAVAKTPETRHPFHLLPDHRDRRGTRLSRHAPPSAGFKTPVAGCSLLPLFRRRFSPPPPPPALRGQQSRRFSALLLPRVFRNVVPGYARCAGFATPKLMVFSMGWIMHLFCRKSIHNNTSQTRAKRYNHDCFQGTTQFSHFLVCSQAFRFRIQTISSSLSHIALCLPLLTHCFIVHHAGTGTA